MNFELTGHQREIKERAAEFADREVAPNAAELDREDRVPFETLEKLAEAGFMGLCVPEEYGGAGADFLSYCLLIEEISRADAGVGVTLAVHTSAGTLPILMFGTEEQKARWVPPLARGRRSGPSPSPSPRLAPTQPRYRRIAERVSGGYRISGHKQWVTNGRVAGTMILFARAEGGATEGVTAFVVPMDAEGISFGKHAEKMGVISATTDDVLLENVFVPEEDRLGRGGQRAAGRARNAGHRQDRDSRPGRRYRRSRLPLRRGLRRRAHHLRQADSRAPGHSLQARRHADEDKGRAAPRSRGGLDEGPGDAVTEAGARAKLYASQVANEVTYEAVQVLAGAGT